MMIAELAEKEKRPAQMFCSGFWIGVGKVLSSDVVNVENGVDEWG